MKFQAIHRQKDEYPVTPMCRWLHVSRSGYYAWTKRTLSQRASDDEKLKVEIRAYHKASRGTYGSPRILVDLNMGGRKIGRNRVIKLMKADGLSGRRKKRYVHTTNSNHEYPVAENILDRNFSPAEPNHVWAGDITYVQTLEGWVYLAVLLDLYSRKVIGWATSSSMTTELPLRALKMAYMARRPLPGLIHHTDRGSQYASKDYRKALEAKGTICSMSRRGECWDNAVGESFFARIKDDLIYRGTWSSRAEVMAAIDDYIEKFYNINRRHSSNGNLSPSAFEMHGQIDLRVA